MNWRCFFGFHRWTRWGEPARVGGLEYWQIRECRCCHMIEKRWL